jgi:hypothetical protein
VEAFSHQFDLCSLTSDANLLVIQTHQVIQTDQNQLIKKQFLQYIWYFSLPYAYPPNQGKMLI